MQPVYHDQPIAMTATQARAITTSLTRAEGLPAEGYTFRRLHPGVVEVKGQPTTHKTRSGGTRIDPHGPYIVDAVAGTCTCPQYANHAVCKHSLAVRTAVADAMALLVPGGGTQ